MKRYTIHPGDNLETLRAMPDNSVDAVVTDPPYGLGKEPDPVEVMTAWCKTGYHEIKGKGFMGKSWDAFVPQPILWREVFRVLKPGGHLLAFAGTRTQDWMCMSLRFAGFEIRDMIAWVYGSGFPKSLDVSKAITAKEKTGGSAPKNLRQARQGDDYAPTGQVDYRAGRKFSQDIEDDDTETELTDSARAWSGWGTALKPSLEPITLARNPLGGTVAANVLEHGTGGINIDGCRVGTEVREIQGHRSFSTSAGASNGGTQGGYDYKPHASHTVEGRWPANLIHDGSEEATSGFPVTASRFFYCAKASARDRDEGLERTGRPPIPRANFHPTVKPTALMRYLCRLITPPDGVILDPFMGSGSTGKAALLDGFRFIGMELDPDYCAIAEARIRAASGEPVEAPAVPDAPEVVAEPVSGRQLELF